MSSPPTPHGLVSQGAKQHLVHDPSGNMHINRGQDVVQEHNLCGRSEERA